MEGTIPCTCWCEAEDVLIPSDWVGRGQTRSCGLPQCRPDFQAQTAQPGELPVVFPSPIEVTHNNNDITEVRTIKMNRFKTDKYDVKSDSVVNPTAVRKQYPNAVIRFSGVDTCACGCGETPKTGGSFLMGHDMRLLGILIRVGAANVPLVLVDADSHRLIRTITSRKQVLDFASSFTTERKNWTTSVSDGIDRVLANNEPKVRKVKATSNIVGKVVTIKIGRWTYDAKVAKVKGDKAVLTYATKSGDKQVERPLVDVA